MSRRRRVATATRDQIVELKLSRLPVSAISDRTGVPPKTIELVWADYLEDSAVARSERGGAREELLLRQERLAADARLGAMKARAAEDTSTEVRFIAAEAAALQALERLTLSNSDTVAALNASLELDADE